MTWLSKKPYLSLLISMTIVAAIPLVFSHILWTGASGIVNNQMQEIIKKSHIQNQTIVDNMLHELKRMSASISTDFTVRSMINMNTVKLTNKERINIFEVRRILREHIRNGPENIRDIYIFSNQKNWAVACYAMRSERMINESHYNNLMDADSLKKLHMEYSTGKMTSFGENNDVIVYTYSIPVHQRGDVPDWQLVIILNNRLLESNFISPNELDMGFLILNGDGTNIIAGNNDLVHIDANILAELKRLGSNSQITINGETYLFFKTLSNVGDYHFYSLISYDYFKEQTYAFSQLSITVALLCLLLVITAIMFLSHSNYIPIGRLLKYIKDNYGSTDPESNHEGIYAIHNTVQKLIIQKQKTEEQLEEYNRKIGINYLKALLQGETQQNLFNDNTEKSYVNWINNHKYVVAFFCPIPSEDDKDTGKSQWYSSLEDYKQKIVQACDLVLNDICFWELTIINGVIVIVLSSEKQINETIKTSHNKDQEELRQQIDWHIDWVEQLKVFLYEKWGLSMRISISGLHEGIDQLETAYHEAALSMEYCISNNRIQLSCFDSCDFKTDFFLRDWININKLMQFTSLVSTGDFREAINFLDNLLPDIYLEGILKESELSNLQLASLKYHFLQAMDLIHEQCKLSRTKRNEAIRRIISSSDHYELKIILKHQLAIADEYLIANRALDYRNIDAIKNYINENYDDNQLSVASIAEYFNVAPNTLSKFFSRNSNLSMLEYIHMVRVSKARALIENEPNAPLYEIAEKVGYSNTLTFTRAFKSFNQGMTPGEYRSIIFG